MENKKREIPWWLVVALMATATPVGVILLMLKLFAEEDGEKGYTKRGYKLGKDFVDVPYTSSEEEVGAKVKARPKKGASSSLPTIRKARRIRGIGLALALGGSIVSSITFLGMMLDYYYVIEAFAASMITFLAIGVPGVAMSFWGNSMLSKAQRHQRYSHMIGDSREVSIDRLAGALGLSFEKVCSELQGMMGTGFFEGYYIDYERRVLTCGRLGSYTPPAEEPAKAEKKDSIHPADRIKAINREIIRPEVSEKITRLEMLTRRIYNYTEIYPQKERFAASFKERYLPMTIKILEAYSRFERSGSSGENVRSAMKDVEAVLDVLIQSFEKQLDMLYMDEALDISTDIDVLESMLSGSGLGESPFAQRGM